MATLQDLVGKMTATAGRVATRHYRPHPSDSAAGCKFGARVGGRGASAAAFSAVEPPREPVKKGGNRMADGHGRIVDRRDAFAIECPRVIKVYRDDDVDRDVFKNEVRVLTMLGAAGVAHTPHVFGVGTLVSMAAGYETMLHPWILMEHCGETIKSMIPRLTNDRATTTELARQICAALACIHRAGIIHCDVNPANITVRDRVVKLIDFGSATPVGTAFSRHPGTVCYQAPEIKCELGYDTKCDIWSAGVTIFEMFTGFIPFDLYGDADVMYSVDDGMDGGGDGDGCDDADESGDASGDSNAMSDDEPASDNESTSEEEIPADIVAETVAHLAIIYKVIAAPDPQPAGFAVQPVPVPLGLAELISLNIDADLADVWYISDIVAPLLKVDPAERPAADQILKN